MAAGTSSAVPSRNPAGIDLADGTFWDDLGMVDNDWVEVRFDWTAAPTPAAG